MGLKACDGQRIRHRRRLASRCCPSRIRYAPAPANFLSPVARARASTWWAPFGEAKGRTGDVRGADVYGPAVVVEDLERARDLACPISARLACAAEVATGRSISRTHGARACLHFGK